MYRFNKQEVAYGYDIKHLEVDSQEAKDPSAYPVKVIARKDGEIVQFEAKYALVSCFFIIAIAIQIPGS